MGEMRRATAREEEERKRDRFASTMVIAASIIAAVRLARGDISRSRRHRRLRLLIEHMNYTLGFLN